MTPDQTYKDPLSNMFKRRAFVLILAIGVIPCALKSQTVESILKASNLAESGPLPLRTLIRECNGTRADNGSVVTIKTYAMAPNRIREEYIFPAVRVIEVLDGEKGWAQAIFVNGGARPPAPLSLQQKTSLEREVIPFFANEFLNYTARGAQVELIGTETLDSREVYEIELIRKDGSGCIRYIDSQTFIDKKRTDISADSSAKDEYVFNDNRKVGGYVFPFQIVEILNGHEVYRTVVSKVEVNGVIDETLFLKPEPVAR